MASTDGCASFEALPTGTSGLFGFSALETSPAGGGTQPITLTQACRVEAGAKRATTLSESRNALYRHTKAGPLLKRGFAWRKKWVMRWLALSGRKLHYFEVSTGLTPAVARRRLSSASHWSLHSDDADDEPTLNGRSAVTGRHVLPVPLTVDEDSLCESNVSRDSRRSFASPAPESPPAGSRPAMALAPGALPRGSLELTVDTIVEDAEFSGIDFAFAVKPPSPGPTWYLAADSEEEKRAWMQAVSLSIELVRRSTVRRGLLPNQGGVTEHYTVGAIVKRFPGGQLHLASHKESGAISVVRCFDKAAVRANDALRTRVAVLRFASLRLKCSSLLRCAESYEDERHLWMVFHPLAGTNIIHYIAALPAEAYTERVVASIVRQLAEALQALHDARCVHRNVQWASVRVVGTDDSGLPRVQLGGLDTASALPRSRTTPSSSASRAVGAGAGAVRAGAGAGGRTSFGSGSGSDSGPDVTTGSRTSFGSASSAAAAPAPASARFVDPAQCLDEVAFAAAAAAAAGAPTARRLSMPPSSSPSSSALSPSATAAAVGAAARVTLPSIVASNAHSLLDHKGETDAEPLVLEFVARQLSPDTCTPAAAVRDDVTGAALAELDPVSLLRNHQLVSSLAPEWLRSGDATPASDLWALGVLLYTLLAGYPPPGTHAPAAAVVDRLLAGELVWHTDHWADVSEGAKDVLAGLLQPDPSERLTAADVLSHPWVQHTAGSHGVGKGRGGSWTSESTSASPTSSSSTSNESPDPTPPTSGLLYDWPLPTAHRRLFITWADVLALVDSKSVLPASASSSPLPATPPLAPPHGHGRHPSCSS